LSKQKTTRSETSALGLVSRMTGRPYREMWLDTGRSIRGSVSKEFGPAAALAGVTAGLPQAPLVYGAACGQHESAGNMYKFCLAIEEARR
jgi:hypothetical protein